MSDSVRPIDGSPPGSTDPGILQARALEWVAISFSNAWKWKVKVKSLSHVQLFVTPWTAAYQAPPSMGFSRQEYWSGVPSPYPVEFSSKCKGKMMTCLYSKYLEGYLCQINYSKLGIKQKDNFFFFGVFSVQYWAWLPIVKAICNLIRTEVNLSRWSLLTEIQPTSAWFVDPLNVDQFCI